MRVNGRFGWFRLDGNDAEDERSELGANLYGERGLWIEEDDALRHGKGEARAYPKHEGQRENGERAATLAVEVSPQRARSNLSALFACGPSGYCSRY